MCSELEKYGGHDDYEYAMSYNDYDPASIEDMVEPYHDMELYNNNDSTSNMNMVENHYYDHDIELYTEYTSTSIVDMVEHHTNYDTDFDYDMEHVHDIDSTSMEHMMEHHYCLLY